MMESNEKLRLRRVTLAAVLLAGSVLSTNAYAADEPAEEKKEIVVQGSLGALPLKDVGTIFGFNKNLVETPRSASTISKEQMERFGATEIYDLVAQSPGVFTNSFFGVGGALDIRGTPGEIYFRGMRRLDNPGNYPTPLGASDRIDIVRGPSSPIYGPSKTGGYMNFVPKSARAGKGKFLDHAEGEVNYTGGSWSKNVLSATIRGPGHVGSKEFGYSLYGEVEDSGSYYRNMGTKQTILQASFEMDLTPTLRLEFGGMYHNYKGQQNGGWNRLTQALVNNGTYITGTAKPLDTNGDGLIQASEFTSVGNFNPFFPNPASVTNNSFKNPDGSLIYPWLALNNVGTATLSRKNVLTGPNDKLWNKAVTLYADLIWNPSDTLEIKNQLFYDGYDNMNENAYGFSQFHNSYVIEDKIVATKTVENSAGKFQLQLSPSVRYTDFLHGDDFTFEYFHRVDLTQGYTALSARRLSTQCDCEYSNYVRGYYTDTAFAALADLDFKFGLDVTLGARFDNIDVRTSNDLSKLRVPAGVTPSASANNGIWSWTASANYKLPFGLVPYGTVSRQSTVIAGQGAEIYTSNVLGNAWTTASRMWEAGIKGSWLGGRLYAAIDTYNQKRTDFSIQSSTVNQSVETRGIEAEVRWSVDRHLLISGNYTKTKVYNLSFLNAGSTFSFLGIEDLKGVDPSLILGGQPGGLISTNTMDKSRRAGIPTNTYSATATYAFDNGLAFAVSASAFDSVFSGQSQAVRLPAYTLVDLSASYKTGPWLFRVVVKNATDATYFRANFTELFGSTIVLPEKPRSVQGSVVYKF
ncbi:TonB-dependent siderophore receptor [Novosphingobium sp. KACC 22771]|uniref:TonB-dependent siderophore receptor n=1 Tax=Novosphingobium sp. KACC 22771 TaxID=3025670 RepID=UPI002365C802|nr:TonB-dependent receptor plug domain-containing protein [Novosphingobium sp. KACC 22771]WDF73891.1 TonB-dependent receptor plug domain-containing protein [Novosphingobium sp. KACC 22771]